MKKFAKAMVVVLAIIGISFALANYSSHRSVQILTEAGDCIEKKECSYSFMFEKRISCVILRNDSTGKLEFIHFPTSIIMDSPKAIPAMMLELLSPIPQKYFKNIFDFSNMEKIEIKEPENFPPSDGEKLNMPTFRILEARDGEGNRHFYNYSNGKWQSNIDFSLYTGNGTYCIPDIEKLQKPIPIWNRQ